MTESRRPTTGRRPSFRAVPIHSADGRIIGTGVAVAPGMLLTALHVVDPEPRGTLRVASGLTVAEVASLPLRSFGRLRTSAWASYRRARALTGVDAGTVDLALLAVPGLMARPLRLRHEQVQPDERITVVGFPAGRLTVTAGPVSSVDDADFVAHLMLGPGSSGSPAIDADGRLAGLATMDHDDVGAIFVGPLLVAEFVTRTSRLLRSLASTECP